MNPLTQSKKATILSVFVTSVFACFTLSASVQADTQDSWRMCRNCQVMFYDGFPDKGTCAAMGGHGAHVAAQGFNFILPYNAPETKQAQAAWRYCNKCHAMFYAGFPNKGRCPSGGGHRAQGFNFALPHDVPPRGDQANWRYCGKCHAMFYDGSSNKGRCALSGGHEAQGFNFVLKFRGNQANDVEQNPVHE